MIVESETNRAAYVEMINALRSGNSLCFAGAGTSRPLGYPTWPQLIALLAAATRQQCGEQLDLGGRLITVAEVENMVDRDALVAAHLLKINLGQAYYQLINETFAPRMQRIESIEHLISLPFRHLLTSNYDTALELAHKETNRIYHQLCLYDADAADFIVRIADHGYERRIVHVHGRHDEPEHIVLTEDEYTDFYSHSTPVVRRFWETIPVRDICVFFGFSFADLELLIGFKNAKRDLRFGVRHHALLPLDDKRHEIGERTFYNVKYGIEPVFFDKLVNFRGYATALREIVDDVNGLRTGAVMPFADQIPLEGAQHLEDEAQIAGVVEHNQAAIQRQGVQILERLTEVNLERRETGDLS